MSKTHASGPQEPAPLKSGFVALLGRPNAGKSTLTNRLVGEKVAIVSDKPQTTRNSIRGVYTDPTMQAVFIDTPGVHKPKFKLGQRMMEAVNDSLAGCDLVLYLVDVTQEFGSGEQYILHMLRSVQAPVFLILNKIDQVPKEQLLPRIADLSGRFPFREVVPVSALTGENTRPSTGADPHLSARRPPVLPGGHGQRPPGNTGPSPRLVRKQALLRTSDEGAPFPGGKRNGAGGTGKRPPLHRRQPICGAGIPERHPHRQARQHAQAESAAAPGRRSRKSLPARST